MRFPRLERLFPNLRRTRYTVASEASTEYNCIAWAAQDTSRWWWPDVNSFWPAYPKEESLQSFVTVFERMGYALCDEEYLEPGFEKVAIYADSLRRPKHMARQLPSGKWTSKCGDFEDITHALEGLEGESYGAVVLILKRKASTLK